jgi:hypothetical protein
VQLRSSLLNSAACWLQQRMMQVRPWDELAGRDSFRGASIAIVGNAGYLSDFDQGERIDSHDLVLRMNNFRVSGMERQVGSRLDIFMSTFFHDVCLDNPLLDEASYLIASVPNNFRKHDLRWRHAQAITAAMSRLKRREVFVPPLGGFREKLQQIGKYPTTGAMALYLVIEELLAVCGSVYVTGFSFFAGRSHYFSQQQVDPTNHDPQRERILLAAALKPHWQSGRITFDSQLTAALGFSTHNQTRSVRGVA